MGYEHKFSESEFWEWMRRFARETGRKALTVYFELWYAARADDTPVWAKAMCVGALGYLIFPFDMFIDPIFHDDLSVATAAIVSVGRYVTVEIKERARHSVDEWLGPGSLA